MAKVVLVHLWISMHISCIFLLVHPVLIPLQKPCLCGTAHQRVNPSKNLKFAWIPHQHFILYTYHVTTLSIDLQPPPPIVNPATPKHNRNVSHSLRNSNLHPLLPSLSIDSCHSRSTPMQNDGVYFAYSILLPST